MSSDDETKANPSTFATADDATPAAVATASNTDNQEDATLAQAMYAVESLVQLFGFSYEAANEAVNAVGVDITACSNWILNQGLGQDEGGAIYPIDPCEHVQYDHSDANSPISQLLKEHGDSITSTATIKSIFQIPCVYEPPPSKTDSDVGRLKSDQTASDSSTSCPMGENWICLTCAKILCSRYINGHGVCHWEDTHHSVAVSLADLSVWCHSCQAYIKTNEEPLKPLLRTIEEIKFGKKEGRRSKF